MQDAKVLSFGDQTARTYPTVKRLYQHAKQETSALHIFLQRTTDCLVCKQSRIPVVDRYEFLDYHSLLSLAESCENSDVPDVTLSTTLLSVSQLGELILYVTLKSHSLS